MLAREIQYVKNITMHCRLIIKKMTKAISSLRSQQYSVVSPVMRDVTSICEIRETLL